MSRQDKKYKAILFCNKFQSKILSIDAEKNVKINENKISVNADTLGKLRGILNSYLRLMRVIEEVRKIGRRKKEVD